MRMVEYDESKALLNIRPNRVIYNTVINAWAQATKRPEAPYRALEILQAMRDRAYTSSMDGDAVDNEFCPDIITYTTVLNAFAKQGLTEKAEEVFDMMVKDCNEKGNTAANPDEAIFNALLNGFAVQQENEKELAKTHNFRDRHEPTGKAPERAEHLLERMIEMCDSGHLEFHPTFLSHTTVLKCWARSGLPDGPQRALRILHRMRCLAYDESKTHLLPSRVTYHIVADCFSKKGDTKMTESLLKEMWEEYRSGRNPSAKPSTFVYTSVISAYGRCNDKSKIDPLRAEALFREMQSYDDPLLKPEHICWTALIDVFVKASMHVEGNSENFLKRAEELHDEMIAAGVKPSAITYNTLLKAYAYTRHPMKDRLERAMQIEASMKDRGIRPDSYTRNVMQQAARRDKYEKTK